MKCNICDEEAVGRCYSCGELFCSQHGQEDCLRCMSSVMEGDPRTDRLSKTPLAPRHRRPGWWRPLPAEEYTPPACHECGGLTRRTCTHCQQMYCNEHAGGGTLCRQCARSSRIGMMIMFFIFAAMGVLIIFGFLSRQ